MQMVFDPYLETMNLYAEIVIADAGRAPTASCNRTLPAHGTC
jgi:hypothetical protein